MKTKTSARLLMIGLAIVTACYPPNQEEPGGAGNPLFGSFYFASKRVHPRNQERDGDIFAATAFPGALPFIQNISDYGTTPGDDDDHLCLLDLQRFRLYFMSRRSDIGNTAGDLDVFAVPSLGGAIVNMTGQAGETGEDFCNAIHVSSGDLIFTSNRQSQSASDSDIYRLEVTNSGGPPLPVPGTLTNLTNSSSDSLGAEFYERFESLVGDSVVFSARRGMADSRGITNANLDLHIFSINLTTPTAFTNLTQDGTNDGGGAITTDRFCGAVPAFDANNQNPRLDRVVFESDQNAGQAPGGVQFHNTVFIAPSYTATARDTDIFVVGAATPGRIVNLSDGASGFNSSGDHQDACHGIGVRRLPTPKNPQRPADYIVVFGGERLSHGTRSPLGIWNHSLTQPGPRRPNDDLFMSDIPLTVPGNTIIPISDGPAIQGFIGTGLDRDDRFAGFCGTAILFNSVRSDIEANPGGDYDLYLFDAALNTQARVLSLSNNATTSGDGKDCFLGCELNLGAIHFVSNRGDAGNTNGPTNDSDLFRVRIRNGDFSLKARSQIAIENMTDSTSGDGYDFAGPAFFALPNQCDTNSNSLESEVAPFQSNFFQALNIREYLEDDFGFGTTQNNAILFTSQRVDPINRGADVDIFSQALPNVLDAALIKSLANRTDAATSEAEDANDGLEAVFRPVILGD